MLKRILFIVFIVFLELYFIPVSIVGEEILPEMHTISEINKAKYTKGTYLVEGYVVKIDKCHEAKGKDRHSMCLPPNITISEIKKKNRSSSFSKKELVVFVEDTEGFKMRKKYRFLLQILDVKTLMQISNNIKVIYFEEIK